MLTYRTFRNTDPPVLAALWRSRTGQPGLAQPVSTDLLEQLVFSRLFFDYGGLVLAYDDGQPMGFAHAGFGPNSEADWISPDAGVTCLIVTRPECPTEEVAAGLLGRCEEFLRGRARRFSTAAAARRWTRSIGACTAAANCPACWTPTL